jgi:acetate kinase
MSSRSGDLDPGIVDFLHCQTGMTSEAFNHMVHFESGLLGVSGLSADMELLIQQADNNPHAADAVNLFCYQTRKAIGSLTAILGGLDSLVFAGGIGENAPHIRAHTCEGLNYLGLALDAQRNQAHDFLISAGSSRVGVHVMHADEATVIAAQTQQIFSQGRS